MSTLKVDTIQDVSGIEKYTISAWMNLNCITPAIRGSGNVSSTTDGGVGIFTMNLSSALADANYSTVLGHTAEVSTNHTHGYLSAGGSSIGTYTTTAVQFSFFRDENSANRTDQNYACLQVVR